MISDEIARLIEREKNEACTVGRSRIVSINGTPIARIEVVETRDRELEAWEAYRDELEVFSCVAFVHLTAAAKAVVMRPWSPHVARPSRYSASKRRAY